MTLFYKDLQDVSYVDLKQMIGNISEGKNVEFKRKVNISADKEKKEFLADISSFSNTSGGYLFYGVDEEDGVASDITGIEDCEKDQLILTMESIIRDGVEPRIRGIATQAINCPDNKIVIVIYIPTSWNKPHMVTFKNYSRFFARNSGGKFQLDIGEIRTAVLESDSLLEKVNNFRAQRLMDLMSGDMCKYPKIVLHIKALQTFGTTFQLTTEDLNKAGNTMLPMQHHGYSSKLLFDGLRVFFQDGENIRSYIQLFRNGVLEVVDTILLEEISGVLEDELGRQKKMISSVYFEPEIINVIKRSMQTYKKLEIEGPFVVGLSLLGVKGYIFALPPRYFLNKQNPIEQDNLNCEGILLQNRKEDIPSVLKSTFDMIWNSVGLPKSINYDGEGKWAPHM